LVIAPWREDSPDCDELGVKPSQDESAVGRSNRAQSPPSFARFSSEAPTLPDLSEQTRHGVTRAAAGYETDRHGQASASFAQQLDDEFIDRFAVAGPADEGTRAPRSNS
jgi:hypothetical protein